MGEEAIARPSLARVQRSPTRENSQYDSEAHGARLASSILFRRHAGAGWIFAVLAFFGSVALADADVDGVSFSSEVVARGHRFVLNGTALREATVFHVNVYAAGLYVERRVDRPAARQHGVSGVATLR